MKNLACFVLFLFIATHAHARLKLNYTAKAEVGYLNNRYHFITYDIGDPSQWNGYKLNTNQNGTDFNISGGFNFRNRLYTSIGLGYLNFEGISGISGFADIDFLLFKSRFTPLANIRVGHCLIWNQYEGGSTSTWFQPAIGLSYKVNSKFAVYAQTGMQFMLESFITPLRVGIRVN